MADKKGLETLIEKLKKDVATLVNGEGEVDIDAVRKQKKKLKRAQRKLSGINEREKKLKERSKNKGAKEAKKAESSGDKPAEEVKEEKKEGEGES